MGSIELPNITDALTAMTTDAAEPVNQYTNPWALTRESAAIVRGLIEQRRCRSVLEFGAGESSRAIAAALAATGGGRLTSVDHAPEYLGRNWQAVEGIPTIDEQLVVAPLCRSFTSRGIFFEYKGIRAALAKRAPFDFVLIDAPPGHFGRDCAMHAAFKYLATDALILLDDANRWREQTTIRRWLAWYPGVHLISADVVGGRGLALMQFDGSRTIRWALRAFAGTLDDWRMGL